MGKQIVTRVAPSPTGPLHIGLARTALFNYLYAKKHGGQFILRIEDTDKERSKDEYERDILDGLLWLGIAHDKLYRQSERIQVYKAAIEQLIKNEHAYVSKEPKKNSPGKTVEVVRLRNKGETVMFTDLIRGDISTDTTDLGDLIIARAHDAPLYHLAVVIDDEAMGVTHVIRGEDHISNTARQILIQRALGYKKLAYAHVPLILNENRSKMSKRGGDTALRDYREKGYLSSAIINYLALLGWNPGTDQEIFTLENLVNFFDLSQVQSGSAIFNEKKLKWFNRAHMNKLSNDALLEQIIKFLPEHIKKLPGYSEKRLSKLTATLSEHISVFADITNLGEGGDLDYYFAAPKYKPEVLLPKEKTDMGEIKKHLEFVSECMRNIPEDKFDNKNIRNAVWEYATKKGRGVVLWPMRVALSGKEKSPDPFTLATVLGKEETLKRILTAVKLSAQYEKEI